MIHYVLLGYSICNTAFAVYILWRSRQAILSQFYCVSVGWLVIFSAIAWMLSWPSFPVSASFLQALETFLFALFPFVFLHFIVVFVRRYEILQSKGVVFTIYLTGFFSYGASLLGYSPTPVHPGIGLTPSGYVFIITWMSIYFAIGIAMLYSLIGGFLESSPGPKTMVTGFILLLLILPGPFALSVLSSFFKESFELYFVLSVAALAVVVYMVFRHRIMGNTPYDTLKSTLAAMNDILFKLGGDFTIEMLHGASTPILGYTPNELIGRSFSSLISNGEYLKEYRSFVYAGKMMECYFDSTATNRNGGTVHLNISLTPIFSNEEISGFVCLARNITERKDAEMKLRRSEETIRALFETVPCGIYQCTPSGTITAANSFLAHMLGYDSSSDLIGLNVERDIYVHPEERRALLQRGAGRDFVFNSEVSFKTKDGRQLTVLKNTHFVRDENGLKHVEGMAVDLTERKRLEAELRQSQKMESLGTLAGGIAHDFNNILQILIMAINNLKHSADQMALSKNVEMIAGAAQRGANLVQQILTFAQKRDTAMALLDMNLALREIVGMSAVTFPQTISLETALDKSIPFIRADRNQIEQVILNLCTNARDAMPNGGHILIRSSAVPAHDMATLYPNCQPIPYVRISVTDTGTGMDAKTLNRVFEPFFTTKEQGKGTGLGLAVVYGIIKTHQGYIDIKSEVGKGTTVSVFLPSSTEEKFQGSERHTDQPRVSSDHEKILLVEDEQFLLETLASFLKDHNYSVISSKDGYEAVEIYRSEHKTIDLVITDIGLPKIDGWDVFVRMKEINPSIKAIVMTGHLDPVLKLKKKETGILGFIQKPFQPGDLLSNVQEVLKSKGVPH